MEYLEEQMNAHLIKSKHGLGNATVVVLQSSSTAWQLMHFIQNRMDHLNHCKM